MGGKESSWVVPFWVESVWLVVAQVPIIPGFSVSAPVNHVGSKAFEKSERPGFSPK